MNLLQAIKETDNLTETDNGEVAYRSSLNHCVDFFYKVGSARGKNMVGEFALAYEEDKDIALRILQWSRDVRGGAGERQHFRDIIKYIATQDYEVALKLLPKIPELGRWDDILVLHDTPVWPEALKMIVEAVGRKDGLCCKWLPREKGAKGDIAKKIIKATGISPKGYRKAIVSATKVVEQKMCAKEWDEIDYSKVPSLASARYQKAFWRNDTERYSDYINSLEKGESKINDGAIYPHDVVLSLKKGNDRVASQQWKALPDYVQEGVNFLPVVDVSGSMNTFVQGSRSVLCLDVAVSLGLYLSERNKTFFKDHFITFSETPKLQEVKGDLKTRHSQMVCSDWGMNTNFEAVFKLILESAMKHRLSQEELPDFIIVLSDMQFDRADTGLGKTALETIRERFDDAGYICPQMIFWNLNGTNNVPVTVNDHGVALVSGFSPSLMKALVGGGQSLTPMQMMLDVIMNPRYNV